MTLSRQVLRKIDDVLRAEFDQEKGEWMAKVPISGASKVVWQRYCQAVGVGMGEGVALLILHELASVAGEDAETLADRRNARDEELKERVQELKGRESELNQRDRALVLREADLEDRAKDLAARERNWQWGSARPGFPWVVPRPPRSCRPSPPIPAGAGLSSLPRG